MIHQADFTTILDLPYWVPELDYSAGDILFAHVQSNWTWGYNRCGLFRLNGDYATSGETHDGVFIIASNVLTDMYWERIYKGRFKWFESPITEVSAVGSGVTVTHDADTGNARHVFPYEVDTAGGDGASIDSELAGCDWGPVDPTVDNPYVIVGDDSGTGDVVLSTKKVSLVIDQHVLKPSDWNSWQHFDNIYSPTYIMYNKANKLWVVEYMDTSGDIRLMWLRESGGVYSFDTTSWPADNAYGYARYAKFCDDKAMTVAYGHSPTTINNTYMLSYSSGSDEWSLEAALYNSSEYWGTGKAGFKFYGTSGNTVITSGDEPPAQDQNNWINYYSFPKRIGYMSSPWNSEPTPNYRHTQDFLGWFYDFPWADDTLIHYCWRVDTDTKFFMVQIGTGLSDYIRPFYGSTLASGIAGDYAVFGYDNKFLLRPLTSSATAYIHYYNQTKSGEELDIPQQGTSWTKSIYNHVPGGNWPAVPDSDTGVTFFSHGALFAGDFYVRTSTVFWWDPTNMAGGIEPVSVASDISIPDSVFFNNVTNAESNIVGRPVDATGKMMLINSSSSDSYGVPTNNVAIGHLTIDENAAPESAYIIKPAATSIVAPVTISTPTIDCTTVGSAICRFALTDTNNNLYKWSGTAWVSCTYLTANTEAEFLAATFNDAITQISADLIGICVVLHTDGTNSPIFRSIDFVYTRKGKWTYNPNLFQREFTLFTVKKLSSTQTRLESQTTNTYKVVLRVGIWEP